MGRGPWKVSRVLRTPRSRSEALDGWMGARDIEYPSLPLPCQWLQALKIVDRSSSKLGHIAVPDIFEKGRYTENVYHGCVADTVKQIVNLQLSKSRAPEYLFSSLFHGELSR